MSHKNLNALIVQMNRELKVEGDYTLLILSISKTKQNKFENDEQTVTQVKFTKFLGVVFIDESLGWKENINIQF